MAQVVCNKYASTLSMAACHHQLCLQLLDQKAILSAVDLLLIGYNELIAVPEEEAIVASIQNLACNLMSGTMSNEIASLS